MKIVDLTEPFVDLLNRKRDPRAYEALYPALFDHYFRYWCPRVAGYAELSAVEVGERANRVKIACERLERDLGSKGLETHGLKVVLLVGGNTSNGHAFRDGNEFVVWIPVELYTTELLARIFVAHEIFHALHYAMSPDFYFENEGAKGQFGRQLITEGVATYLTAALLEESDQAALWADYLGKEQVDLWLATCRMRLSELLSLCRRFFEGQDGTDMFMANEPDDILKYRAGYFVGLELIRQVVTRERLSPIDLLTLRRERLESLIIQQL